ncbi:transmembrane and death domain protein 1 [Indicator indicator]|uniref:transmembrane and death domain protein 1 n=1 Tax=Indicator indicator TaxID=1002788 RepID=UPI0023DEED07|nr:transmembrane and death domain protein 1 [Indicator indicator]
MLAPAGLILLLLAVGGQCEDTVVASVGRHTMSRIVALLSPAECRQLRGWLMGPEEALEEQHLEQLSEEKNPIRPRQRRHLRGPSRCSAALRHWRSTVGAAVTWDRLARGLRRIGRADIARELGKNLNQDRSLELRRNVEDYGRALQGLSSGLLLPGGRQSAARGRRALLGHLGELRFERRPQPPYSRSLLGWVTPLVSGVLGGFLASVLLSLVTAWSCRWALGSGAA